MSTQPHEIPRTFEVLDVDECLHLVRWEAVGRVAFSDAHDAPAVLPVNFAIAGDAVVFRTDSVLAQRLSGQPVSFQVDRVDTYRRVGWSVLIRGRAELVDAADTDVRVEAWAPGEHPAVVRIVPTEVTGRRLELVHGPVDERGYL
jgi:uncharacterized protein